MISKWLSTSLWISIYSILWSIMEVEIEGKDGGWAKNLPTENFCNTKFTWYHIIMNIIVIITIVYALFGRKFSEIFFYIIAWFLLEDFLWFMINKGFGWSKYTKKDIWWHSEQPWILEIPLHNYICVFLLCISGYLSGNLNLVKSGVFFSGVLGTAIGYSCIFNN